MNNKKNFPADAANLILKEGMDRFINPTLIFNQVYTNFCNKMKLAENFAESHHTDIIDALRYAVFAQEHADAMTDTAPMCRCVSKPAYDMCQFGAGVMVPRPKKIHYSSNYTIVMREDGTKTVVKCAEGQVYSEYTGFVAAFAKKAFGNNSQINKLIRDIGSTYEPKAKKTTQDNTEEATAESDVDIKNH